MKSYKTEKRIKKITSVIKSRQPSLKVIIENVHDPHNVSAILRTCDAVGVSKVSLVYNVEKFPRIGKKSSASAAKWVEKEKFKSIEDCYSELIKDGFQIYTSAISDDSKNLFDLDFTKKTAIVLGNEHRGVSEVAANLADEKFIIPMYGMVQSLNVSVAAAVILYEALRQRRAKGMYNECGMNDSEFESTLDKWLKK